MWEEPRQKVRNVRDSDHGLGEATLAGCVTQQSHAGIARNDNRLLWAATPHV
jgi:hypothetical protein